MKKCLLIFLCLIVSLLQAAPDTLTIPDQVKIAVLEEKVNSLQQQLSDAKELQEAKKQEIEKLMQAKEAALDQRMIMYSGFFVALLGIAIWLFNWLGKKEIRNIVSKETKKTVTDLSQRQVTEEIQIKLSKEVIDSKLKEWGEPVIKKIITEVTESHNRIKESEKEIENNKKKYEDLLEELKSKSMTIDANKTSPEEKLKVQEFTKVLNQVKDEKEFTAEDWFYKAKQAKTEDNILLAISYLDKAINIDSNNSYYYDERGFYKSIIGRYEESITDFDNSIRLDPNNYFAFYDRGYSYNFLKQFEKAIDDLTRAIEINPASDLAFRERSFSYMELNNLQLALIDIESALSISPDLDLSKKRKEEIIQLINAQKKLPPGK